MLGDFVYTSPRNGANNYLGNLLHWNNNLYQRNKQDLMYFWVEAAPTSTCSTGSSRMTRLSSSTSAERSWTTPTAGGSSTHRSTRSRPSTRRWRASTTTLLPGLSVPQSLKLAEVIAQIRAESGEDARLQPFSIKRHLDASGVKYSLRLQPQFGWGSVWCSYRFKEDRSIFDVQTILWVDS